jgi:chitodextrinase
MGRTFCKTKCVLWGVGFLLVSLSTLGKATETTPRSEAISELRPLQAGVTLPVQMGLTLRAGKVRPGTVFQVKTTQRVPVSANAYLKQGATVRGEVVASEGGDGTVAHPSTLTIRFTQLSYRGMTVPLETRAVAMANLMDVDDTFLSMQGGGDRGNSSQASWTTRQVGGEEVVRSGWVGPVVGIGVRTVGSADYYGVYSLPAKLQGEDGAMVPRAMGVFSTTAKGLYGYDEGAQLESSGGLITITNPMGRAVIRGGDNLLLEVIARR